jgi:hypothetical protein
MCLWTFGLYCSACLCILFVSILCMCCSHFSWYGFISFTIFLHEFITKIIFISKHFNYNIHFLNIASVRRRPLLTHSRKRFWSSASLIAAWWEKLLPLLPWCSVSNPPLSLVSFQTPCSWDILRGRSIATRDTRSDEYWSANEISTESRQNRCFWKSSPQRKPDALQPSAPWQLKCFESR